MTFQIGDHVTITEGIHAGKHGVVTNVPPAVKPWYAVAASDEKNEPFPPQLLEEHQLARADSTDEMA